MSSVTLDVPLSTGEVSGSVTPGERRFDVVVDTQFGVSFTGSTTATLVPGYNSGISVNLSVNSAPELGGITVSVSSPKKRETVTLSVSVTDQDTTDIQNITWNGGGGRISGSGSSVKWSADRSGSYTVTATADDGHGGVVSRSVGFTLINTPPVIKSVTADKTQVAVGDVVNFSCSATDADGDPLSYFWSDGYGWSASGVSGQYKVDSTLVSALTCAVDDGDKNGKVSGSVALTPGGAPLAGLFSDANLAACVTAEYPSATTAAQVTGFLDCTTWGVTGLSGIENLTGLTGLSLYGNNIVDVTALSGLTGLTHLGLQSNQIVDVTPLASLTGLAYLDLAHNSITTGVDTLIGLTTASIYLSGNLGMSCAEANTLICGAGNTVVGGVCAPAKTGLGVNVEMSFNGVGNLDTPTAGVNCTAP